MKNDLKAPRFNTRKYRTNVITEDLYQRWKAKTGYTISYEQFKAYWKLLADGITSEVQRERDGVILPYYLGTLYIGWAPVNCKKAKDYKATNEAGTHIYQQNWHSNRKLGKIVYTRGNARYVHHLTGWWSFGACRNFSRAVSKSLKDNPSNYKNTYVKNNVTNKG